MNKQLTEFYKQAFGYPPAPSGEPELEKFAALVAAAERIRLFEIVRKKKVAATTEWAKLFEVEDF